MKLEEIGFYTLEDNRAKNVSTNSPLWRCELLLTSRCNFKCPYCRGMKKEDQGDIKLQDALSTIDLWVDQGLKNIRFSGGEPTLHPDLPFLINYCRLKGIKRIALSTNGSANIEKYLHLLDCGVNDFSISLDSCCSATGDILAGVKDSWNKVVSNIKTLSKHTYVTVGVVLADQNIHETKDIVEFAISLGVSDIRLITAAQSVKKLPIFSTDPLFEKYPILKYRLNNISCDRGVRGIQKDDTHKCPLVIDDMAVLNGKHYPCIIYLREQGAPIGNFSKDVRRERYEWYLNHDCYKDPICRENCLDVCIDYNNRVEELQEKEKSK